MAFNTSVAVPSRCCGLSYRMEKWIYMWLREKCKEGNTIQLSVY